MLSSPAKEAAAKARDERAAQPKPTLKTEILEKIGEVMARKGIELTPARQKEMERNLTREAVVGAEEGGGKGEMVKAKAEIVDDSDEGEGIMDVEGELSDTMQRLGIDEMVIEDEIEERRNDDSQARR